MTAQPNPWPETLERLKLRMAKGTFDTWLQGTVAMVDGDTLTVYVKNDYAQDWLERRLHHMINEAVSSVAGRDFEIVYEVGRGPKQMELELEEAYANDYTAIVKPHQVFVGTQYFREVWLPVLGPTLGWLIIELRQRCYYNKRTGEKRDHCQATYAELAEAVGISEKTARRILKPGPLVDEFILERQVLKEYSAKVGRIVNTTTRWKILMDEPIFDPEKHL